MVEQIDRRHESPGETLTALQLRLAGVAYEPQFDVPDSGQWTPAGRGYRADFRVIGHNVLIEFDGKVKYENGDSVFQEKEREDHLRICTYSETARKPDHNAPSNEGAQHHNASIWRVRHCMAHWTSCLLRDVASVRPVQPGRSAESSLALRRSLAQ